MEGINNFQIDKKRDAYQNVLSIKQATEKYVNQESFYSLIRNYGDLFECPAEVLSFKAKQILSSKFNYRIGKFDINFNFFSAIKDFLIISLLVIVLKAFKQKHIQQEKYDIILDDVEQIRQLFIFKKLLTKFNKSIIFTKKIFFNNNSELQKIKIKFSNFFLLDETNRNINIIEFLKNNYKILKESKKNNINFFIFFKPILFSILKYNYFFKKYNARFLIHDRFYKTCPIRNYMFKKNGGEKICLTQIHLVESSISLFCDIDVLLSFGKESFSKEKFIKLGGRINDILSIGSIQMESLYHDEKKIKLPESFDIVFIGVNITTWTYVSEKMSQNYYKTIEWLKKISIKYPKLKILIKHHPSWLGDAQETEITQNSNIKTLIRNNKPSKLDYLINKSLFYKLKFFIENTFMRNDTSYYKKNESYHFLTQSKINLSFGSTMIIEGVGNDNPSYFVDPNLENSSHFSTLKNLDPLRISNFGMLEDIIKTNIENSSVDKKLDKKTICLESSSVSNRIYNYSTN